MNLSGYDVRETIVAPRPVADVRAQVPRGRVGQEFGRHLDLVYAAARAGAVALDGQNIFDDPAQQRADVYYLLQEPLASNSNPAK